MGTGLEILVYAGYAIMAAGFVYGLYMMNKGGGDIDNMDPSSLDDFRITKAEEGTAVPLVYGRRKVSGNIIWYDNLYTEEVLEEVDTGKGDEWVVTGYNYFLDIWLTLGHGDMTIIETYIQAELKEVEYTNIVFNNGSNGLYSTIPGEYANAIDGVCHVFYERMLLGENVQSVPTVHYVVEKLFGNESPIDYKNLSNGANPAAIVYDLLIRGGASSGEIDLASFQAAASYWNDKDYGLNLVFTNRPKTREAIRSVLQYVGAAFGQDDQGRFYLNALDEDDTSQATLTYEDGDFTTFSFERTSWDKLYTDFVATYIDEDQEYTERTVKAYNPAVARILGRRIEQGVKLQAFRDLDTVSRRIWEIMKEGTYPFASIQMDVPLRFYALKLGDVVTINYSKYNISNAKFRVMKKTIKDQTNNSLTLVLRQKTEELYDSNWTTAGGTSWSNPDFDPSAPYATKVWQLPYNHITGSEISYLLLVARTNTFETGYVVYSSLDGSEYQVEGTRNLFAQYGLLSADYPITYEIDETVGLTYTPYQEDPIFDTISLDFAMQMPRLALVGDELIGFGTVTLNVDNSITLTNCIRGMLGTTMVAHSTSDPIWIFSVDDRLILRMQLSEFYLKLAPFSVRGVYDVASLSSINVDQDATQSMPAAPNVYVEFDTGSDFIVTVFGSYFDTTGAGMRGENFESTSVIPSSGRIGYKWNANGTEFFTNDNPFTTTRTSTVFYVWYEENGMRTAINQATVSTITTPQWIGQNIPDVNSGLAKLQYGQQNFIAIADMDAETIRGLVYLSSMLDTDMTGIADEDYFIFDAAEQKFVPVGYAEFNPSGPSIEDLPSFIGEHGPYDDGSITADSNMSNREPEHAFDGGLGNFYPYWVVDTTSTTFPDLTGTHWWQIDLDDHGGTRKLVGLRIHTMYNDATDIWPKNVKVVGSQTGLWAGEELTLFNGDIVDATTTIPSSFTGWTSFTDNIDFYRYYRIYIQDVHVYDAGSLWFAVEQWQFKEAYNWTYPKYYALTYGISDGLYSDLTLDDGEQMTIVGIDRTIPLEVDFFFGDVSESSIYFNFIGRYEGVDEHNVKVYAYNYTTEAFVALTANATDLENRTTEDLYSFPISTINYTDVDGNMDIKIKVVDAGDENDALVIEKVNISTTVHEYYTGSGWDSTSIYSYDTEVTTYDRVFVSNSTGYGYRVVVGLDEISGTDKAYFEVDVDSISASNTQYVNIGISDDSPSTTYYIGSDINEFSYCNNGQKRNYGSAYAYGSTYTTGDIIGVAVDFANNRIWFAKNNVWQDSGDPTNGTGYAFEDTDLGSGPRYPAACVYWPNASETLRINAKATEQTYTAPTGFTAVGDL